MVRRRMELLRVLKPGEPGTEDLMEQFGADLVCVRFWYDPERDMELKTAEIVEEEEPWLRVRRRRRRLLAQLSPRGKR